MDQCLCGGSWILDSTTTVHDAQSITVSCISITIAPIKSLPDAAAKAMETSKRNCPMQKLSDAATVRELLH